MNNAGSNIHLLIHRYESVALQIHRRDLSLHTFLPGITSCSICRYFQQNSRFWWSQSPWTLNSWCSASAKVGQLKPGSSTIGPSLPSWWRTKRVGLVPAFVSIGKSQMSHPDTLQRLVRDPKLSYKQQFWWINPGPGETKHSKNLKTIRNRRHLARSTKGYRKIHWKTLGKKTEGFFWSATEKNNSSPGGLFVWAST